MTPKILIATPVRGASPESADVCLGWSEATRRLSRDPSIEIAVAGFGCDLVRCRSRMVRQALEADEFTHVLWWDADIIPRDMRILANMLATGHDIVAAPYPRKLVDWGGASVAGAACQPAEWGAYRYPYYRDPARGAGVSINACVAVDHIGMGFMLTTTTCLQKIVDAYRSTLSFGDTAANGDPVWTVAIFQLMIQGKQVSKGPYPLGALLSEDYSFCERAKACGFIPQMYLGEGSPVDHVGTHVFRGHREGIARSQ
jgi:hypothetical protein